MHARGRQSVAAGRDIGWAVTGNHNQVLLAPPVRSAYREQISRIAPGELLGREAELAELAAFCTADSGPSHAWWRGDAWAGKSALSAWFALHPPPGVRVVAFFVTARHGEHNHVVPYADNVLEQLAELVGEGLPGHLTPETRDGHLLRLYREAARSCARRGERLVLLVDGLDEDRGVTTGPDAHSIAGLLPARPEWGMRVLVTGRPQPPLPADVPAGHPLRDPGIVRTLRPSPHARVIRVEAEREIDRLLQGEGLEHDLLGLVTAAGGGLTADDLADLTRTPPHRVRRTLDTRAGRTFTRRARAYLLAHEELQRRATDMLGETELGRFRDRLHGWADDWRDRGWPPGTPGYLLHGYFRVLADTQDSARVTRCALDERRRRHMLEAGSVAPVLEEIETAQRLLAEEMGDPRARGGARAESGQPGDGVLDLLRLRMYEDEVRSWAHSTSPTLAWAWAALGQPARAEAMARTLSPGSAVTALARTARELAEQGLSERASEVAEAAEKALRELPGRAAGKAFAAVHRALVAVGLGERAAALPGVCCVRPGMPHGAVEVVATWVEAGERGRATAVALGQDNRPCRDACVSVLVGLLLGEGLLDQAWDVVVEADGRAPAVSVLRLALALARAGRVEDAERLWDNGRPWLGDGAEDVAASGSLAETVAGSPAECDLLDIALDLLATGPVLGAEGLTADFVAMGLLRSGQVDRAEEFLTGRLPGNGGEAARQLATALTRRGRLGRVRRFAGSLPQASARAEVLAAAAETCAETGRLREAESFATSAGDAGLDAVARGAVGWARAGHRQEAVELLTRIERRVRTTATARGTLLRRLVVARELAAGGHSAAARGILGGVETAFVQVSQPGSGRYEDQLLVTEAAAALAKAGESDRAEALLRSLLGTGPYWPEHWAALGRARVEDGRDDKVEELLTEAPATVRDEMRAEAAVALAERGEAVKAAEYAAAIGSDSARLSATARTARALARRGLAEEARAALSAMPPEAVSRIARRQPLVLAELFRAWAAVGEPHRARVLAHDALRCAEATAPYNAWRLVGALARAGFLDEAKWFVRRRLPPGEPQHSPREELSAALAESGQVTAALNWIRPLEEWPEAAVALARAAEPAHARALLAHALCHGEWTDALKAVIHHAPAAVPLLVEAFGDTPADATAPGAPARTSAPPAS
jgi:tetratricopeptide (TPR) repeat protein